MRKTATIAIVLALAACDKPAEDRSFDAREAAPAMADAAGEAPPAGPNVGPTAAPGVAFNYRYDFRLEAPRIAEVQERHAQACEKLGIDRCRITGMSYQLINDRDIAGMLAFKLDPSLARQFGKDGVAAVTQAEGMLVRSEISGVDAGSAIGAATRAEGRMRDERARLEARLKEPKLTEAERAEIRSRLDEIARAIEAARASRDSSEESLATTPMVFNYGSGDVAPGFDSDTPIRDAFRTAGETLIGAVAVLIVLAGALLPIAVLIALMLLGWRLIAPAVRRARGNAFGSSETAGAANPD